MRLDGVGRRYGLSGTWVLREVDLELRPGTLVRFQGANGTGKSTLLRVLAGIDAPSRGRVTGRPARVGYVPERFPGALPFTALGYLTHLGRIHGLGRGRARGAAGEWLERFGAAGHARTPVAELSKGTAQKVAVAQALLAEPGLLVLDEAWTGLDEAARGELDRVVAERVAAGATVAFVDHDPLRLADVVDAGFRVEATRVLPVDTGPATADRGPRVRITAVGPPGAAVPAGLPGAPAAQPGPEGATVLTVAAVHSDGVLRGLLGARPPWHVREVTALDGAAGSERLGRHGTSEPPAPHETHAAHEPMAPQGPHAPLPRHETRAPHEPLALHAPREPLTPHETHVPCEPLAPQGPHGPHTPREPLSPHGTRAAHEPLAPPEPLPPHDSPEPPAPPTANGSHGTHQHRRQEQEQDHA